MRVALRAKTPARVPCGTCQGCCTSAQFVPVEPDETDTLAHIAAELRFPDLPTAEDRRQLEAVRAAARWLQAHGDERPAPRPAGHDHRQGGPGLRPGRLLPRPR